MGVTSDSSGDAKSARGTYSAPLALGRRTSRLCFTGARAARLATLPNATSRKYTVPASLISFMRVHASHTQPPYSHDTLQMRSLRVTTYSIQHAVGRTRGGTARYQYAVEKPTGTRRRGPGSHAPRCSLDARLEAGIRRKKGPSVNVSAISPAPRLPAPSLPVRARTNASRRAETPSTIMTQIRRHFGEKRQERR